MNVFSRVAHDLGLAAWFGGTLANAVSLNRASGVASDPVSAGRVTNAGWDAWTPVNAAAIGAHIAGSVGQIVGNADRIAGQKGVGTASVVKTGLTVAALGVTGYSRLLGQKINQGQPPVSSATEPTQSTPPEVADAQKQLKLLQWVIPALTGALVIVTAFMGEQQRVSEVKKGVLGRLNPVS